MKHNFQFCIFSLILLFFKGSIIFSNEETSLEKTMLPYVFANDSINNLHLSSLVVQADLSLQEISEVLELLKNASETPQRNFYIGMFLLKNGQFRESISIFSSFFNNSSADILSFQEQVLLEMGNAFYISGEYLMAIEAWEDLFWKDHQPIHQKAGVLLAQLYLNMDKEEEAKKTLLRLIEIVQKKELAAEAWLRLIYLTDKRREKELANKYREKFVQLYPDTPVAVEAFFTQYSYHDYLQGDKIALKHLEGFLKKYPKTPFSVQGWYLMGLDQKRERKNPEGRWIRKRNLIGAIASFQTAEKVFDSLYMENKIADMDLIALLHLRYRSNLERAIVNRMIATESEGTKKQIYLEYAIEVYKNLLQDLKNLNHPCAIFLQQIEKVHRLQDEATVGLAQTLMEIGEDKEAKNVLEVLLKKTSEEGLTRGYFLSLAHYELGILAKKKNDYQTALNCFLKSEDSARGKVLSADQRIRLWIEQSECYKIDNRFDEAVSTLSKAINDEAISSLRIEAMFLRSDIYQKQGRFELATKQLEAILKKGGEWALKAKEKLEEKNNKEMGIR